MKKINKERLKKENFITKQKNSILNLSDESMKFSFKYLDMNHVKFSIKNKNTEYFIKVLERLKAVCAYNCLSLKTLQNKSLRNHFIDWKDVSENSFGIPNESEIVERPFQFCVSVNEHGRVIGFFIKNIFHIVWFDHSHRLYS